MALKLATELPTGVVAQDAYYKIGKVVCGKDHMSITVAVFFNQQAREQEKQPISTEFYQVTLPEDVNKYVKGIDQKTQDIVARGYLYLKENVDKFSSAVDV
jgi:glutamyl/glutaminyl-tRNA synthetase